MKDFLYNKSDIIVALVIILAAALLIYSRVDVIMGGAASSEINGGKTGTSMVEQDPVSPDPGTVAGTTPEGVVTTTAPGTTATPQEATPPTPPATTTPTQQATPPSAGGSGTQQTGKAITFTVKPGTGSAKIGADLKAAGLITSIDAFNKEVTKQKAESKLKAGTFRITPGTSVANIVKLLSK